MSEIFKNLNRLAELCLNIARVAEEAAEENKKCVYLEDLKLGYKALSRHLREGVKAIIDIQEMYVHAKEVVEFAESGENKARDFLGEVFGDRNIECVNNEYKNEIKAFVKKLLEEEMEE